MRQATKHCWLSCLLAMVALVLVACGDGEESFGATSVASGAAWSQDHLSIVNQKRQAAAVQTLVWNEQLAQAALNHARDMAVRGYFGHISPEGDDVGDRVARTGYLIAFVGENLARGEASNQEVIDAWMTSPGHRENMLYPDHQEFGAARVGNFWVQVFATPFSGREKLGSEDHTYIEKLSGVSRPQTIN